MSVRPLLVGGLLSMTTAACLGPDLGFAGGGGGGGDATTTTGGDPPASSSTGGGGDAATTSTTSTTSTGGGAPECIDPDGCAVPGDPCFAPACNDGVCGEKPSPLDTPCEVAGQLPGVCDGEGMCVLCTADAQCAGTETCDEELGACVPRCENGDQDGDETDVDCGGSCEADCDAGQGCIDRTDCASNVCEASSTCASGKLVFVTADWLRPDFGGALAADAICQQTAETAGFGGTFMAWLSDSTTSPSARFTPSVVPYRALDGTVIAGDWAQLTSGILLAGIELDENGGVNPFAEVWTGTYVDGTLFGTTCLDWTTQDIEPTGFAGMTTHSDERWTIVYSQFCNRTGLRLYCFQQ